MSTITWILACLVTVIAGWLSVLLWKRRFVNQMDSGMALPLPPGSMGYPIVGEMIDFAIKGTDFLTERLRWYGHIYKTHYFGMPIVRISGADLVGPLIHSEPHSLRAMSPEPVTRLMGPHSVLSLTGAEHARVKKHIAEAFTPSRLSDYLPCIQQHVRAHLKDWCSQGPVLGFQVCERLVCDVTLEIVLGCNKENDTHGLVRKAFATANKNLFCVPFRIPGLGLDKVLKAREVISHFVRERLQVEGDKDYASCLDVLKTNCHGDAMGSKNSGLSPEEIEDNMIALLIAASSTTSGAMCCSLLLLAQHPEVMDQLQEELQDKGLLSQDCPEELTFDLVQSLKCPHYITKEVLRLYPPAGAVFRQANKTLEVGGYQIPKDWTVVYNIRDTQNLSKTFEAPTSFKPSRWGDAKLNERLKKDEYANYFPFGLGMRACVGKTLANLVLAVFLIELVRLATYRVENLHPKIGILPVAKPTDNMPVTFARKHNYQNGF